MRGELFGVGAVFGLHSFGEGGMVRFCSFLKFIESDDAFGSEDPVIVFLLWAWWEGRLTGNGFVRFGLILGRGDVFRVCVWLRSGDEFCFFGGG